MLSEKMKAKTYEIAITKKSQTETNIPLGYSI